MAPYDSSYATSHQSAIVSTSLSYVTFQIFDVEEYREILEIYVRRHSSCNDLYITELDICCSDSAGMSAFTSIYSELRKNYIGEMARYDNLKSLKLVRIESSYAIIY